MAPRSGMGKVIVNARSSNDNDKAKSMVADALVDTGATVMVLQ